MKNFQQGKIFVFILAALAGWMALFFSPDCAFAKSAEAVKTSDQAILLVHFGSSLPQARSAYDRIEQKVKQIYPDIPIRTAWTSHMVRKKLAKTGTLIDSPEMALSRLMDEGFQKVAVFCSLMIPGREFHDIAQNARLFERMSGGFRQVAVAGPLLNEPSDLNRAADALISVIPKERRPEDAVVWIGHGTGHPSDALYAALLHRVQQLDPNLFVGTVTGYLSEEETRSALTARGVKRAFLMPLMTVAGDHAQNDIAGDEDSWKSGLSAAGIECIPVLKGLGDYDEPVAVWMERLDAAMKTLQSDAAEKKKTGHGAHP